jgi:Ca-activated chloride channel family protein
VIIDQIHDQLVEHLRGFRFASPWLLLLLLLLPLWAWLRGRYAPTAAVQYSSAALLKAACKPRFSRNRLQILIRFSALNLLILALARPQLEKGLTEREAMGINIMFNLDFSSTMRTRDFVLDHKRMSRADAMKSVVTEFIRSRPSDRIGAVRFDAGAHLISPLTLDHDWLVRQLALEQPTEGTAPGSGMLIAAEALQPARNQTKVMITLTDAEQINQGPSPEQVARAVAPMKIKCHVIQIVDSASMREIAASAEVLQNVARLTGGQFFQVADAGGLRSVYRQIDQLEKAAFRENRQVTYRELMEWFAWPAGLILLVELMMTHLVWRRLP